MKRILIFFALIIMIATVLVFAGRNKPEVTKSNLYSFTSVGDGIKGNDIAAKSSKTNNPAMFNVFDEVPLPTFDQTVYLVSAQQKRANDASDNAVLRGFNYSPMALRWNKTYWDAKDWQQDYYIENQPITTFSEAGNTYFFRPEYKPNQNSWLMDFDLKFPDFDSPKNKTIVVQATPERERKAYNYLRKGVTYSRFAPTPQQQFRFAGDEWVGAPGAYNSSQEAYDQWLRNIDANELLRRFQGVAYPTLKFGYVMLNWEVFGQRTTSPDRWKVTNFLKWWSEYPHTNLLGCWGVNAVGFSRIQFEGDYDRKQYLGVLDFQGSLEDLVRKFPRFGIHNQDWARYVDVLYVGGYMNYPTNNGIIHHYMTEYLLNKKYYPNKKVLATIWPYMEPVGGEFPNIRRDFGNYYCFVKPTVFNDVMFNWGVWATAVGDGLDCWFYPATLTNNRKNNGEDCFRNGTRLPFNGLWYPNANLKNVDDLMAGIWAVSQNKDIIEAPTEWVWVTNPIDSFDKKTAMVAYKNLPPDPSATAAAPDGEGSCLILVYDNFHGQGVNEYSVVINGKTVNVKTMGTRTSVIRTRL